MTTAIGLTIVAAICTGMGDFCGGVVGRRDPLELTRFPGHLILGLSQGKEAWNGSTVEVSGGVPA